MAAGGWFFAPGSGESSPSEIEEWVGGWGPEGGR